MIAQELEVSLHMAFMEARQKRHEFITVEHLLLALLDNPSASEVLKACVVEIEMGQHNMSNVLRVETKLANVRMHRRDRARLGVDAELVLLQALLDPERRLLHRQAGSFERPLMGLEDTEMLLATAAE
jgi:ATP-dependent Clp protease ATP-binding subunit ClpA